MPGLDKLRFLRKEYLDEFVCGICRGVVVKPRETLCCQQLYCRKCLNEWMKKREICPYDRKMLTTDDLRTPSRITMNLLNALKVKCEYHDRGCDFVGRCDTIDKHQTYCEKNPKFFCEACGAPNGEDHDCIKGFMSRVVVLSEQNMSLKSEVLRLKTRLSEIKDLEIQKAKKKSSSKFNVFVGSINDLVECIADFSAISLGVAYELIPGKSTMIIKSCGHLQNLMSKMFLILD